MATFVSGVMLEKPGFGGLHAVLIVTAQMHQKLKSFEPKFIRTLPRLGQIIRNGLDVKRTIKEG